MTPISAVDSPELDPAARWREHYETVEQQYRALGAARRRLRTRLPSLRRRKGVIATIVVVFVVLACAASALLWL
jgi:hypothetical protein